MYFLDVPQSIPLDYLIAQIGNPGGVLLLNNMALQNGYITAVEIFCSTQSYSQLYVSYFFFIFYIIFLSFNFIRKRI